MSPRSILLSLSALLLLSACNDPKEAPGAHLKEAQEFFNKKDYARALVEIRNAIKADPKNSDVHYLAGEIQEATGDIKTAFGEYARAALPDANNFKAQIKVVQLLIAGNQLDTAFGRINGTLGSRPNDPEALALRALIQQKQGKADRARTDAQAALSRAPGQPVASAVLASQALSDKNPGKALTIVDAALQTNPNDAPLQQFKAAAYLMQDRKDLAIAVYDGLVKTQAQVPAYRIALAELRAASGEIDAGEQVLRDGVAAAPESREMRGQLVEYLRRHRDTAAVGTAIRAAIDANPKDSSFDLLLADQLVREQNPDGAAAVLKTAIARVPDGAARSNAQLGLARLSLAQSDDAAARKALDDILAAQPDNDDALLLRAAMLIQADDTARAVTDLLGVVSRQPTNVAPLRLLADAYVKQNETDKALDALKRIVYFLPTDPNAALRLAQVYQQAGKVDAAKQALTDFVGRNPTVIEGPVAEIRLAVARKDWTAAQAALTRLRTMPKADQVTPRIEAELYEAREMPSAAAAAYKAIIDKWDGQTVDREVLAGFARTSVAAKEIDPAIATLSGLAQKTTAERTLIANVVLAALYDSAGQGDKATEARQAAITAAPKVPAGYIDAALAFNRAGAVDRALTTLAGGVLAGAPREPLLMTRAGIEEQAGRKDAAIGAYQEILRTNPRSVIAANNYASLVADAKPQDKTLLTQAREPIARFADNRNPAILDTIAWIDYRLGDFKSAKDLLLRAKADTAKSAQLRFHYGAVLMALGDKDAGRMVVKATMDQTYPGKAEAEHLLTE